MRLDGGPTIEAETLAQELNITMKWLEYPAIANNAVGAEEIAFAAPGRAQ